MTYRLPDARSLVDSLIGIQLQTPTGRPNTILRIEGENTVVATSKSPKGKTVPLQMVQAALDILQSTGRVVINPREVGYRSAFIGAILCALPAAKLERSSPPIIKI